MSFCFLSTPAIVSISTRPAQEMEKGDTYCVGRVYEVGVLDIVLKLEVGAISKADELEAWH